MPDAAPWIAALRQAHNRFVDVVAPLDEAGLSARSYASEWSIADVASHLGSQAEIFLLALQAGIAGSMPPGREEAGPIWDRWNALPPLQQADQSLAAGDRLVTELEALPDSDRQAFAVSIFGQELDLVGLSGMRLNEATLHGWDIAVALDPAAVLLPAGVELIIDLTPAVAGRAGRPHPGLEPVEIVTRDPARSFLLTVAEETVTLDMATGVEGELLILPAEAFIRLLAGRLDPDHTPAGVDDPRLPSLRTVFPGL